MFSHVGWHVGLSVKPGLNGQVSFSQKRFHIPNRVTLILIISEKSAFQKQFTRSTMKWVQLVFYRILLHLYTRKEPRAPQTNIFYLKQDYYVLSNPSLHCLNEKLNCCVTMSYCKTIVRLRIRSLNSHKLSNKIEIITWFTTYDG